MIQQNEQSVLSILTIIWNSILNRSYLYVISVEFHVIRKILVVLMQSQNHTIRAETYSQNTTTLATSGTLSIIYMFRPLIGHHQVVFNLSCNYTI